MTGGRRDTDLTRQPASGGSLFGYGKREQRSSEIVVEKAPSAPAKLLVPFDKPNVDRIGLIRTSPFEHYCAVCGRDAGFGFGCDLLKGEPGTWFCGEHRPEGERRWSALGRV